MKSFIREAIFLTGLVMVVESAFGQTWTQTTATNLNWSGIASSADGTKLAAIANASETGYGGIFTSINSGASWTQRDVKYNGTQNTSGYWSGVACSADGTKLVACADGYGGVGYGGVYISTNSGVTWTNTSAPYNLEWMSVASSADGSRLLAVELHGGVYVSTTFGMTWSEYEVTNIFPAWGATACSADGTKMATMGNTYSPLLLLISTNTGLSWQAEDYPQSPTFGLASAADGSKLFVLSIHLYVSTNWGVTWSTNPAPPLQGLYNTGSIPFTCSANGSQLVVGSQDGSGGSVIYTSTNSGLSWTSNSAPYKVFPITSSADGGKSFAVGYVFSTNAGIWVSQSVSLPQLHLAPFASNVALSWIVPSTNFVLQENPGLVTTDWVTLTNTPTLNLSNLNDEVVLPPSNSNGFFRLISQ